MQMRCWLVSRTALLAAVVLPGALATAAYAQSGAEGRRSFALESAQGLRPHNVVVEPAVFEGRKGVRVTFNRPLQAATGPVDQLAVIEGLEFSNGVIEAEVAGAPAPNAPEGARGFVGIAFRVQSDAKSYDAFYLRPTNGRAEDQERRNHAVQYISHPDFPWHRLRKETPSRYESYVDLQPGVWTKVKIEVRGDKARLYVHDQPQPVLIVNDVKTGANGKGGVALWIDAGTVAHFRNLTVTP
jgi:hypothetical protein